MDNINNGSYSLDTRARNFLEHSPQPSSSDVLVLLPPHLWWWGGGGDVKPKIFRLISIGRAYTTIRNCIGRV